MNPGISDQKAGSVLVFPYYTSAADGSFNRADTLLTISNVCNGAAVNPGGAPNYAFLHFFFINGANCSPADTFVCLTPNGSVQLKASDYDPALTGYLIAVAVDSQGRPTQNNCFIGSAFVRDDANGVVDSYGAEAFWKFTPGSLTAPAGGRFTPHTLNASWLPVADGPSAAGVFPVTGRTAVVTIGVSQPRFKEGAMQGQNDRVVVGENGAFIPKQMFGQRDRILAELDEAGVLTPAEAAPPKVKRVPMIDASRELRWLKEHRREYVGQWVALDGDRLVSHGPDARAVYLAAREAGVEIPFVAHVDPPDPLPF
jgi:hypothetical protein